MIKTGDYLSIIQIEIQIIHSHSQSDNTKDGKAKKKKKKPKPEASKKCRLIFPSWRIGKPRCGLNMFFARIGVLHRASSAQQCAWITIAWGSQRGFPGGSRSSWGLLELWASSQVFGLC